MCVLLALLVLVSGAGMVHAQPPILVGPQGQYLGTLSANPYDPNSVSKPVRSLRLAVQRGLDQQSVQPVGLPVQSQLGDEPVRDAWAAGGGAGARDAAGLVSTGT